MFYRSKTIRGLLEIVPGKRRLGAYRFLPIFFCIGGVMEWIMINVRIGKETFCKCRNLQEPNLSYTRGHFRNLMRDRWYVAGDVVMFVVTSSYSFKKNVHLSSSLISWKHAKLWCQMSFSKQTNAKWLKYILTTKAALNSIHLIVNRTFLHKSQHWTLIM